MHLSICFHSSVCLHMCVCVFVYFVCFSVTLCTSVSVTYPIGMCILNPSWICLHKNWFVVGICHCSKPLYGVQFHPEVDLTKNGITMLRNFLYNISGCSPSFTIKSRESQCINDIKEKIGNAKVLVREIFPYKDI